MAEATESTSGGKSGGLGCGAIIAIVLVLLILATLGGNELFGYYLANCSEEDFIECLLDAAEEPEPESAVTATGTYTYQDYAVTVSANIPLAGGAVTGSVSGTCDGKVMGTFDGQDNGVISGTMAGGCSPFFINVPASATFSGTVNKTSETVPFSFNGAGAGLTHEGTMTLTY